MKTLKTFVTACSIFCILPLNSRAQTKMTFKPAQKWFTDCMIHEFRHYIRKDDGTVWYCVAGGKVAQVVGIDHVTAITSSTFSMMALKDDGTVWIWGDIYKKTGNPDSKIMKSDLPVQIPWVKDAVDICIGTNVAYAVLKDGSVRVWGSPFSDTYYALPTKFKGLDHVRNIIENMVLRQDGTVWVWGSNAHGQLGNDTASFTKIPVPVKGLQNIIAISEFLDTRYALKEDGTVWTWGKYTSSTPVKMKNIEHAVAISTNSPKFVLLQDGTLMSWGDARLEGTLHDYSALPQKINMKHVIGIKAGIFSGAALLEDGTIMGWGSNMVTTGVYHETDTPVVIASIGHR